MSDTHTDTHPLRGTHILMHNVMHISTQFECCHLVLLLLLE